MGTASSASSSTALSSLHTPGPRGQAAVLPLSSTLVREAPRSARTTIRCLFADCRLVQFVTSDRRCRKCHRPLDPPPDDTPQPEPINVSADVSSPNRSQLHSPRTTSNLSGLISTTEELDELSRQAASMPAVCPALATINQCLPVVLCWFRVRGGWSQKYIGTKSGLGRSRVNAFEQGRILPNLVSLGRLAGAMDVDMTKVLMACEYLQGRVVKPRCSAESGRK